MGIYIFNNSISFHKLSSLKEINNVLKKLESKFPIEVYPNYLDEVNFYKFNFKESISDEILAEVQLFLNQFNRNA